MKYVSLSNNTVQNRIDDMASDIKSQLIAKIKASTLFGIQLDESVDIANLTQFMVLVRDIHSQVIKEDLLFCRPLETSTKAADVLKLMEDFFEEEELDWNKLDSVCTDGAPAVLGARSGFLELVKRKNSNVVGTHCFIHRKALASRTMSQPLKQTLDSSIKVINYIKAECSEYSTFQKTVPRYGS